MEETVEKESTFNEFEKEEAWNEFDQLKKRVNGFLKTATIEEKKEIRKQMDKWVTDNNV